MHVTYRPFFRLILPICRHNYCSFVLHFTLFDEVFKILEPAVLFQKAVYISNVNCEAIRALIALKLGGLLSFMIKNAYSLQI